MITKFQLNLGLAIMAVAVLVAGLALTPEAFAQEGDQPFIGIRIENSANGALIAYVMPDSPAMEAGLQEGDLITRIDEFDITANAMLADHLEGYAPGDTITLYVTRNGVEMGIELTLGTATMVVSTIEPPMMPPVSPPMMPPGVSVEQVGNRGYLGVAYRVLTPEQDDSEGALILEVVEDSPAAEAGLKVDDVITAVNDEPVDVERTLGDRIYPYETGDTVTLTVLRGDETLTLDATLGAQVSIAVPIEVQPMPMPSVPDAMPAPGMPDRGQFNPRQGFPWSGHHGMHFGPMHHPGFNWQRFMEQHPDLHKWMEGWMGGMMPHHMEGFEGMMPHHMEGFEGMTPYHEDAVPVPAEPGSSY